MRFTGEDLPPRLRVRWLLEIRSNPHWLDLHPASRPLLPHGVACLDISLPGRWRTRQRGGRAGAAVPVQGERRRRRGISQLVSGKNGTLWASGRNHVGQLGDGGSRDRSTAVRIDTGVAAVAAGSYHTLILKRDGSLWGTGHNGWGQLGDGGSRHRRTAVRIADDVQSMAAGYAHSLFVKRDGSLWAVGRNTHGQLGDGTTRHRSRPVKVAEGVRASAAGDDHSLFLTKDGRLFAMGDGRHGQLGIGRARDETVPVEVLPKVRAIAAGAGTVWSSAPMAPCLDDRQELVWPVGRRWAAQSQHLCANRQGSEGGLRRKHPHAVRPAGRQADGCRAVAITASWEAGAGRMSGSAGDCHWRTLRGSRQNLHSDPTATARSGRRVRRNTDKSPVPGVRISSRRLKFLPRPPASTSEGIQ
jgi:hypothetical protein